MESSFSREVSVERFMPTREAAPTSPEIFQAVASRARRKFSRSRASKSAAVMMAQDSAGPDSRAPYGSARSNCSLAKRTRKAWSSPVSSRTTFRASFAVILDDCGRCC